MSKYNPLHQYLSDLQNDSWHASFEEIENILGFSLPNSAHRYPAWWANSIQGSRHAEAWLSAGWETGNLNLGNNTITFCKAGSVLAPAKKVSKHAIVNSQTWDVKEEQKCNLRMVWRKVGDIGLDKDGRLVFPVMPQLPGIYRFDIQHDSGKAVYVGETVNIRRRFGNYRNPGASQQTSLRINALLKEYVGAKAKIAVLVVTADDAWLDCDHKEMVADLSSKSVRCLFENAALLASGGQEIEMLNRAN